MNTKLRELRQLHTDAMDYNAEELFGRYQEAFGYLLNIADAASEAMVEWLLSDDGHIPESLAQALVVRLDQLERLDEFQPPGSDTS